MDPFSLTAGTLQITSACATCTVTIIKWIGEVRTADQRIAGFCEEVAALQATYESLDRSLRTPMMVEAARVANKTPDGANLWEQIKAALEDSIFTMSRVNRVLQEIDKHSGFGRRVKMQLMESLKEGELGRLRQRIQFFNATLSLPIQMVCLTLQLEQRGMSTEHQKQLDSKLVQLEKSIRDLANGLDQRRRSSTLGGVTLLGSSSEKSIDKEKDKDKESMENYIDFARQFLCSASAAASTRSTLSTVSPQIEPSPILDFNSRFNPTSPTSPDRDSVISSWIQPPPSRSPSGADMRFSMQSIAAIGPPPSGPTSASRQTEYKVALTLAQRHLKLGQEKAAQNSHESAEKAFRKALELFEKHDFQNELAFQPAEIVLLLARSCFMQEKYDEAIVLLTPVADMEPDVFPKENEANIGVTLKRRVSSPAPDRLQALAASHMLGEVCLHKEEFEQAIGHSLKAFMERLEILGQNDEKTLDSVRLVIEVYSAMGDEADAEAYKVFLEAPNHPESPAEESRISLVIDDHAVVVPSVTTSLESPQHMQKPKSRPSLTSRFWGIGRSSQSQSHVASTPPLAEPQWLAISRATTLENASHDTDNAARLTENMRSLSSPSESSSPRVRTMSFRDDDSVSQDSPKLDRASSSRSLENTFKAVEELCDDRKFDRAVKIVVSFLKSYNKPEVLIIRRDEIERNIRKGNGKGLAATGKGYAPIHFFGQMKEEHAEEIGMLIKYGVDVNAVAHKAGYTNTDPFTPLLLAVDRGHTAIVRMLLDVRGITTDIKDMEGYTPLLLACRRGHHDIVRMLLEHPDPATIPKEYPANWYGNTLLHDAARHGDLVLVEILLSTNSDVNARDKFGKTPLMHAVIKKDISKPVERAKRTRHRIEVVKALVLAGADVNVKDTTIEAYTAREYAQKEGDEELIELLCSLESPHARRVWTETKPVELLA